MAVLTNAEKGFISEWYARETASVSHPKSVVWTAAQAVEDYFENTARAGISNAIDAAIAPATLTAAQKKRVVRWYLRQKFEKEA